MRDEGTFGLSKADGGIKGSLRPAERRFDALDGWRGICALMIVLLHAPVSGPLFDSRLVRHGFLFVDFFFVLSGFVIAHAFYGRLKAGESAAAFMASRLRRVYPLHIFMLALFLVYEIAMLAMRGSDAAFQGGNSLVALFHNIAMTHSLGVLDALGWNYPSWSISAELLAYGLFALLVLRAGRFLLPVLVAVICVAVPILAVAAGHMDVTIDYGWLRCLMGFSLGALLRLALWGDVQTPIAADQKLVWTVAEVSTVALVVVFVTILGGSIISIAAPFVFAFAIHVFAHEGGAVSRALKCKPIAFLGLVSYSIYMTHAFVISRLTNAATVAERMTGRPIFADGPEGGAKIFGRSDLEGYAAILVILAATLLFSAATWRFVERPGMRIAKARTRRERTGGHPASVGTVP